MVLSKKHYKDIAKIVNNQSEKVFGFKEDEQVYIDGVNKLLHARKLDLIKDLAKYFKKDNPKFDKDKFLDACGVK